MKGQRVGYTRVSSFDQNPGRQLEGIPLDKKFTDRWSGSTTDRPQFKEMVKYLREGDFLIVHSMDRLSRNLIDLLNLVRELTAKKITIEFVTEGLRFSGEDSPAAMLTLSLMGSFAQFERAVSKERQREGIKIAKERGVYTGRPPTVTPDMALQMKEMYERRLSTLHISKSLGVSRMTVYRYLRKMQISESSSQDPSESKNE